MKIEETKRAFDRITHELGKVIVGQEEVLKQMTVSLLTNSHNRRLSRTGKNTSSQNHV